MSNPSATAFFVAFIICLKDAGWYSFGFPLPLSSMSTGMKPAMVKRILHTGFASRPFHYCLE